MEFSRQEYWSALPFPSPVFLPKMLNLNPIMRWDTFRELRKNWGKICEITGLNSCKYQRHEGTVLLLLLSCFSRVRLCATPDGSPPGSPVRGILQARTLEWVAISFSNVWKGKVKVKSLCRVQLFATPWSAAYQAPPSMGFSRQEYWSGVPLPSPVLN